VLANAPLEAYQVELMDLAFDSASAIPLNPHIKDRARAQEWVVQACLELGQVKKAYEYTGKIPNWRAGMGYADLAFREARSGAKPAEIEPYLSKALAVADASEDWRKDRIWSRVSQVQAALGRLQEAEALEQGIEATAEKGKTAQITALTCSHEAFDAEIAALEAPVATGQYDRVYNALQVYAALFDRFYSDPVKQGLIEEKIDTAWAKLPFTVRIELLGQMTESALTREDRTKAKALVDQARAMSEQVELAPRFMIPLMCRLAQLRFRVGDPSQARQEIQAALALYKARREGIINIDRAGLLRPLAEACQATGQADQALVLYKRAVEAGVENPNSRPRAEDLTATCCSMAVHAVAPDQDLWRRIREIRQGLSDPW
jgi:tetratricopeptide (TPR) repeat protein